MERPSRRRRRRPTPAMDTGANPNAAAGHPSGEPTREQPSLGDLMSYLGLDLDDAMTVETPAERSQASSSAAPPSDHPRAQRTGSGRRVRQSLFYCTLPRRRRPSRQIMSSAEQEATNLVETVVERPTSGAAEFHPIRPGARIRQSVLYSNRPRRPQRRLTEEHPIEVSSSEPGGAVTDLPTLEALSMSDPPPLTPQITGDESTTDDDDESSHLYGPEHVGYSIGPIGLTRSMLDSHFEVVSLEEFEMHARKPDPDEDSEESRRKVIEYLDTRPTVSLEEAFDRISAIQYATLTALAAESGTEPPRNPFLIDQKAPSLQGQQQDPAAAAHPRDSMAVSHEASAGDIKDGKKWMRDEVILCFRKHVEKTPYLDGLVFELDELCHQCFNVESYMKVFHHYNFKIKMKMPASVEWTVESYFGEVKEIFGRKFFFCCPLEPNENGHCYACKNQGVEDLKHPVTGGFEKGLPDSDDDEY